MSIPDSDTLFQEVQPSFTDDEISNLRLEYGDDILIIGESLRSCVYSDDIVIAGSQTGRVGLAISTLWYRLAHFLGFRSSASKSSGLNQRLSFLGYILNSDGLNDSRT